MSEQSTLRALRFRKAELEATLLRLMGWVRVPGEFEAWAHPSLEFYVFSTNEALNIEQEARRFEHAQSFQAGKTIHDAMLSQRVAGRCKDAGIKPSFFGYGGGFQEIVPSKPETVKLEVIKRKKKTKP